QVVVGVVRKLPRVRGGVVPDPYASRARADGGAHERVGPSAHSPLGHVPGEPTRLRFPPVVGQPMEAVVVGADQPLVVGHVRGSRGNPSTRSANTLRMISLVPPAMVKARAYKKASCQRAASSAPRSPSTSRDAFPNTR